MTAAWSSFARNVLPEVEGCPLPQVNWAIRDAAIKFCIGSKIWQDIETYTVTATPILITFVNAVANSRVSSIVEAQLGGKELSVLTPETADRYFYGWRNGLAGTPDAVAQIQLEKFAVIPPPTGSSTLTLTVALMPTRASVDGPDFLFEEYYEPISARAKATLMLMAGEKWSNPAQAGVYLQMFDGEVLEARQRNRNTFQTR